MWGRVACLSRVRLGNNYSMADETQDQDQQEQQEGSHQGMTVNELKDELREKDLPVSGKKDELIERLEGSSQTQDQDSDQEEDEEQE